MTRRFRLVLFVLLSLAELGFIFHNSLQGSSASNAASREVAALLTPGLNAAGRIEGETFHVLIRKMAHFVEFGALGLSFAGVSMNMEWSGKRRWVAPVLAALAAAITDETIQHFTGRTSALRDVLIDWSGAACGVFFVMLAVRLWTDVKTKRRDSLCRN